MREPLELEVAIQLSEEGPERPFLDRYFRRPHGLIQAASG
jgi:hypothetical protein